MSDEQDLMSTWPAMVRVCHGVLGNRDDAEDCASEALVSVLQDERYAAADSVEAFMVTVARRRAVDFVRRRGSERRRDIRLAAVAVPAAADVAEAVADQAEARWLAEQASKSLKPAARRVLAELSDGATVAETADRLGLTRRSVESHLLRARRALRAAAAGTLAWLLGWIVRGAKRTAVPAGAATAAAFVIAVAVTAVLPPSASGADPAVQPAAVPAATVVDAPPKPPVPPAQSATQPAVDVTEPPPAPAQATQPVPEPSQSTVAQVQTPAMQANVTSQRNGEPTFGLTDVTHCLDELEVSTERIGC